MELAPIYGTSFNFLGDNAELVCCASGVFGKPFRTHGGVPQGASVSPFIFNIMVDAIIGSGYVKSLGTRLLARVSERVLNFMLTMD